MKVLLGLLSVALFISMGGQSKGWHGIVPLHSTCEDVKRELGVESCTCPISRYTLPDYRVMVEFENETCESEPCAWRVPKGTVTAITISPRNEVLPSTFGLDLSKYVRREDGEIVGVEHYESLKEGVTVNLYRGFVQDLLIYPPASEDKLRCKPLKPAKAGTSAQNTHLRDLQGPQGHTALFPRLRQFYQGSP
jgi:hypothetical protein